MSPTESDLRHALRDGEGDDPDAVAADRIVALGRARRSQRRTRVLSTAAIAVVVAGLATGGAFVLRSGDDTRSSSTNADLGAAPHGRAFSAVTNGQGTPAPRAGAASGASAGKANGDAASSASACPATYPRTLLPGGGSPGQFGSGGKIFASTPTSLLVCAYGRDGSTGRPAALHLSGAQASELAASLENASTTRSVRPCPLVLNAKQNQLAIIGTTADGTVLRTVTTAVQQPQCNVMVTNGTAIRYQWAPPADLAAVLFALTTRQDVQNPQDPAPGRVSKSPVR